MLQSMGTKVRIRWDIFWITGPQLQIPNLQKMGMGNIKDAAGGRLKVAHPEGVYGRFMEHSTGKDTTTGHWEIAGLYTPKPFKTYPDGFPPGT